MSQLNLALKHSQSESTLEPRQSDKVKTPTVGWLPTNHLNLFYMLAAGLLMPPSGFGEKYYKDVLVSFPGWIPLFFDKMVFREAIELASIEANHLIPCLVEIDLSQLSGEVRIVRDTQFLEVKYPDEIHSDVTFILVPAPLPTSWIESVRCRNQEDVKGIRSKSRDYNNVKLPKVVRPNKTLFDKSLGYPWPPNIELPPREVPLGAPLAAGGIMATLFHIANMGDICTRANQVAFDAQSEIEKSDDSLFINCIRNWALNGELSIQQSSSASSDNTEFELFWGAVSQIVQSKFSQSRRSPEDGILLFLDHFSGSKPDIWKRRIEDLRTTLEELIGFGSSTVTESFKRHPYAVARALILFFNYSDSRKLFQHSNAKLGEQDWLAASILFGAREGWLGLKISSRNVVNLETAVSHRMAQMSHRISDSGIDLGNPPQRVYSLRELFVGDSGWYKRREPIAVQLAIKQEWNCVTTKIILEGGNYGLTGTAGGDISIEFEGEPKFFGKSINQIEFLKLLAQTRIDEKTDIFIRNKF